MINQDLLNKFGYTREWITIGIINEEILENQVDSLESDPNPEHHRYVSLKNYLGTKNAFTDEEITALISLLSTDLELNATGYLYLLESNLLTENQFKDVSHSFRQLGNWASDKIALLELKKDLELNKLTLAEISLIIDKQNSKEQYVILENSLNKKGILDLLIKNSKFKKIANRAKNCYSSAKL